MLAPDQPGTGETLGALFKLASTLLRYTNGLNAASFAPANIFGHSVDLFAQLSGVRAKLTQVQTHAGAGALTCAVILMGSDAIADFSRTFRFEGESILSLLADAQLNHDGKLTAEQKNAMHARLQRLCDMLTAQRASVADQQSKLKQFYDLIVTDHAALSTGDQTIQLAIDRIRTNGMRDSLEALGAPGSEAIIALINQETAAIVNTLTKYDQTLRQLAESNQSAQQVITQALVTWRTVEAKYTSLLDDLKAADRSSSALLELLDIKTAEAAWEQLTTYCQQIVGTGMGAKT